MTDDDDISRRYRELPREEPPRHLDDAIRAAARRAVETRPAPLVVPSGRQRWYFPVAAAAIIVLAVAVTIHVERQQPAEEVVIDPKSEPARSPSAPASAPPPATPEQARSAPESKRERAAEAPASRELRHATPAQDAVGSVRESARAESAPVPAPPPPAAPPPVVAAKPEAKLSDTPQLAKLAARSPEQWLQGIADLRAQGRHDEADKELGEFRRRHPNYQIPEAMREKVEKSAR